MSSQPRSILSLSKLAAKFPEKDAFFDLLVATMTDRNDRAAVLTVVSLLEGALQKSLATKFIADDKGKLEYMFGSGAPLRDFSAKIKMGFALGVYGPTHEPILIPFARCGTASLTRCRPSTSTHQKSRTSARESLS